MVDLQLMSFDEGVQKSEVVAQGDEVQRMIDATKKVFECHKEYESLGKSLAKKEFLKSVKMMLKDDQKSFNKMRKVVEKLDKVGRAEYIEEIFRIVFAKLSSQPKEVCKIGEEKLVIGRYGFGLRRYTNAKRVTRNQILELLAHKDAVVKGLKALKLDGCADRFERFCRVVPVEIDDPDEVRVSLKSPVFVGGCRDPFVATTLKVSDWYVQLVDGDKEVDVGDVDVDDLEKGFDEDADECWEEIEQIVAYLQIRADVGEYVDMVKLKVADIIAQASVCEAVLRKEFARELLLDAL